jgi:hypothetical protein
MSGNRLCTKLRENYNAFTGDHRQSPPREGGALLQGILLCGRCGRRMSLRYRTRKGHSQVDYTCLREKDQTGNNTCQIIVGRDIDEAVGGVVIEAVKPSTLDVALEVYEELRARKLEVDRLRRIQVERAREEADLAKRQFMMVRPENRLVADTLERAWNEKPLELAHEEEEYTRTTIKTEDDLSSPDSSERIKDLASDLPRVWNDSRTSARDPKRILRLLIEDVTLLCIDKIVKIHIPWKGGATTSIERPARRRRWEVVQTPPAIVERIRSLAMEQTDHEIARTLNAEQLRSGTGKSFNVAIVRGIRAHYAISSQREFLQKRGWLTVPETAKRIGISKGTVRLFAQEGLLHAVRTSSRGDILFAPLDGFLPKKQQGKKLSDRSVFPKLPQLMRNKVQYET